MNSDLLVLVLSVVMLVGSFSVGLLPALIRASNKFMNLISILGAGLLVGVALIIIIPEGMLTLNQALTPHPKNVEANIAAILLRDTSMDMKDIARLHIREESEAEANVSIYLGSSLIFGFILMLLIDQIFMIMRERYGHGHHHEKEEELSEDLKEQLLKRTNCKYVQNSMQSTRNKKCMRIVRCASEKQEVQRILSDDFTDQKLIGIYRVFDSMSLYSSYILLMASNTK